MHIPEAFWVPFLPWEVRDMSESKEVILEAKHVTRRFRTTDGRTLLANNDVNLKFYKGETLGLVGVRLWKKYFYEISGISRYPFRG